MTEQVRTDPSADFPLESWEVEKLATYNAEVARGLVHSDQHRARMARLQRRFDTVGYVHTKRASAFVCASRRRFCWRHLTWLCDRHSDPSQLNPT